MSTYQKPLVIGVFTSAADAQGAIEDLRGAGFDKSQIGLASQEIGNVTSNLVNELANLGVDREQANFYDNAYKQGRPVVSVRTDGRDQDAVNIIAQHNGRTDTNSAGTNAADRSNTQRDQRTDDR